MHAENELRHGMLASPGYEVLIVIERLPCAAAGIGGHAAVHLPEKVEVLAIYNAAPIRLEVRREVCSGRCSGDIRHKTSLRRPSRGQETRSEHETRRSRLRLARSKFAGDDANDPSSKPRSRFCAAKLKVDRSRAHRAAVVWQQPGIDVGL